jgi:hypothetical protein
MNGQAKEAEGPSILQFPTPQERGERARKSALRSKERRREASAVVGFEIRDHPSLSDPDYSPAQLDFLKAVDRYSQAVGRRYLTAVEYLVIAESLGWKRESNVVPAPPMIFKGSG